MKISELIGNDLVSGNPGDTAGSARECMSDNGIHALPIIDEMGAAIGIVTSTDLEEELPEDTPVSQFMSDTIFELSPGDDARDAAKMMRDHGVHHILVTEAGRVKAVLSSFDLLRVVEES